MRRILRDLKILILTNLWLVPVLAGLVGARFYFAAPPPPMQARMATGAVGGGDHAFAERLEDELARVEVPLSYSSELYQLHMHLRYMIERLHALQQRTTAGQQVG